MTTPADLVRDNCTALAGYHPRLEYLIAEPSSRQGDGFAAPADAPFPGNAQAFAALMVIWEAVFRIEEFLRDEDADARDGYDLTMYPRRRRGPNPGTSGFLAALDAIPRLAAGRDEDIEAWAARALERLNDEARRVRAIDEAQQWRYVRGRACRYCHCYAALRVLLDAAGRPTGHVECHSGTVIRDGVRVRCTDGNGYRPAATMGTDERGVPGLAWADGTWEPAPDMDVDG